LFFSILKAAFHGFSRMFMDFHGFFMHFPGGLGTFAGSLDATIMGLP
jgi:hypothetical protein